MGGGGIEVLGKVLKIQLACPEECVSVDPLFAIVVEKVGVFGTFKIQRETP